MVLDSPYALQITKAFLLAFQLSCTCKAGVDAASALCAMALCIVGDHPRRKSGCVNLMLVNDSQAWRLANCYRSWYILAFQAAILPELLLLSNDCEALDAGSRTGPSAMKTDGAITVQEVERKGSSSKSCVRMYSCLLLCMALCHSCLCT